MLAFTLLKKGQDYLKNYPPIPQLNLIFPEPRIIKSTKFAVKLMPFLAVFAIFWQQIYAKNLPYALALAIITALVALSIPLQGFYWLGKRANTPLPPTTKTWYEQIGSELQTRYACPFHPKETPTYQDLSHLLKLAYTHFPEDYWGEI